MLLYFFKMQEWMRTRHSWDIELLSPPFILRKWNSHLGASRWRRHQRQSKLDCNHLLSETAFITATNCTRKLLLYPPAAWARLFLFQLFLFFFLISPWHLFASRHEWLPPLISLHRVWKWDFLNLMNEMCNRPVIRAGRREIKKSKLNCFTNCLRVCACVVCLRLLLFHISSALHSHTHAHITWCL